jgi:hypothetical protein
MELSMVLPDCDVMPTPFVRYHRSLSFVFDPQKKYAGTIEKSTR